MTVKLVSKNNMSYGLIRQDNKNLLDIRCGGSIRVCKMQFLVVACVCFLIKLLLLFFTSSFFSIIQT